MTAPANASSGSTASPPATLADRKRELEFRVVFLGLILLIAGFTAILLGQAVYPCVPAAGSTVESPLAECVAALSPWAGLAAFGLVLALLGYVRVR